MLMAWYCHSRSLVASGVRDGPCPSPPSKVCTSTSAWGLALADPDPVVTGTPELKAWKRGDLASSVVQEVMSQWCNYT